MLRCSREPQRKGNRHQGRSRWQVPGNASRKSKNRKILSHCCRNPAATVIGTKAEDSEVGVRAVISSENPYRLGDGAGDTVFFVRAVAAVFFGTLDDVAGSCRSSCRRSFCSVYLCSAYFSRDLASASFGFSWRTLRKSSAALPYPLSSGR